MKYVIIYMDACWAAVGLFDSEVDAQAYVKANHLDEYEHHILPVR